MMNLVDACVIQVTCARTETATAIAEALVNERLVACATLHPGAISYFRWQGELQRVEECVLALKTRGARVEACLMRIRALHPDTIPGVIVLPISAGHPPFLEWILEETRRASG